MMHENIELKADTKGENFENQYKSRKQHESTQRKKNNLQLLTFWPSHWNTCEEYGIHTHP